MQPKVIGLIAAAIWGSGQMVQAAEITISCGAVGQERQYCEEAANAWARDNGHTVNITSPPENSNQRYFQYLLDLNDGSDEVDVYQIDIIWPGLLARHFVDLREYIDDADIQRHFPTIIDSNTVDGKLVGMPWFTDVGLLYYRRDLLEKYGYQVPTDWSELADVALDIQEQEQGEDGELWGYVFQGNNYEGLTCNALEWFGAYGGGTVVDGQGNITVPNARAVMALARAAGWVDTIAPRAVLAYNEESARTTFQNGDAVFMRNWPYAWALVNGPDSPVAGQVGVAPLPQGGPKGRPASVLGGWQLAVSRYSNNPQAAAELVGYLTSEAVQRQRAIEGAYAPTIVALYEDPQVLEANPFFETLRPILDDAIARPASSTGDTYMAVSAHIWEAVHDVLQGYDSAAEALAKLRDQLRMIQARGEW
ncbi:MAG: ABC transporter substrate-binding protein [Candidatus Competibacteraceae bacterium]|nr:ABC transporter substrate-binding protein [Candidatus Competibacteraceae bacterium]